MSAKWEKYTEEELASFVAKSKSYRELASKIGYAPDGGSVIKMLKKMIATFNFDISHFTGQGWNKNNFDYSRFRYGIAIKVSNSIEAIVALRGHKCECCGLSEWNNKPITLEIHHKDGDHLNNVLDNLQLLCPNCHSQTDNWRGKNINKKEKERIPEEQYVEALRNSPNIRQALIKLGLTAAGGNYATCYDLIEKYNIEHLKK